MPNTREKLVELIMKSGAICYSHTAEELADHLIVNGVTINTGTEYTPVGDKLSPTDKDINVPSKWIPVTERLPEPFEIVLVYDHTGKSINWAYMTRHREWVGTIVSHIVTHWMPLPEPPKGE